MRISGLVAVLVLVFAVAPATADSAGSSRRTTRRSLQASVLVAINHVRAQHGLRRLRLARRLSAAAASHSAEMAYRGYFSHSSADGTAFWERIRRYYRSSGYRYWWVGENILWSSPTTDAARALQMWMASPPHRANLLKARWREIGISAVHVASAPGFYGGRPTTVITTDFGVRH